MHRLLIDATEQPMKKSKRKLYYSEKKKRHTHKTQTSYGSGGRIIQISKTKAGSVHDLTIGKSEKALSTHTQKYCDLG